MDHARGEVASANGSDLDPDIRRFIRSDGRVGRALSRSSTARRIRRCAAGRRKPARPGGRAGRRCSRRRNLDAPTRHGRGARAHPSPAPGDPARPRLPAWRRLDAVQHRYPRSGHARVRRARRLLRDRRRLRAVARAQVSGRRSSRSVDVVGWLAEQGRELGIDARPARDRRRLGRRQPERGGLPGAPRPGCRCRRCAAMLLNYGAFVSQLFRGGLPPLRRPGIHAGLRGDGRVLAQLHAHATRTRRNPLVCPLLASLRRPAARVPRDRRVRHPRRAERRDGASAAGRGRARAAASSIPARRTASSRPCRLPRSATRRWRTLPRGSGRSSARPVRSSLPMAWPERDGLRPCRECAGCGGD